MINTDTNSLPYQGRIDHLIAPIDQAVSITRPDSAPRPRQTGATRGTRLGRLTLITDPREYDRRIHGWPCTCTWFSPASRERYERARMFEPDRFPEWPEGEAFPPPCSQVVRVICADVRCDCGRILPALEITGDRSQWIACRDCYRQMRNPGTSLGNVA